MDEGKRNKFIVLGAGIGLLVICVGGWTWWYEQHAEQQNTEFATNQDGNKPLEPMPASATDTGANPTPAVATNPAEHAAQPAVDQQPVTPTTTGPVATTTDAATTPVGATPATTPAVAEPKPVVAAKPVEPAKTPEPVKTPEPIKTPVAAKPVQPVEPVKTPVTTPVATAPATSTPVATAPVATSSPVASVASVPGAPVIKKRFPAVAREEVIAQAHQVAGRTDPMSPYIGGNPFPYYSKGLHLQKEEPSAAETQKFVPPPPVVAGANPSKGKIGKLEIPEPPTAQPTLVEGGGVPGGLPIDQLPQPPSKPTIGHKLTLCALVGNKAMFKVPAELKFQNKWPSVIALAPGEQFESINVVSIDNDSVTIDEDGERSVKTLPSVR